MAEATFDVVAVGNAIVDVLARVDDAFLAKHNLAKKCMTLIDEKLAEDIYNDMPPATQVSGGSVANTVAGIASFGGKAAFIGKVRDDELGKVFAHDLRSQGVTYTTEPSVAGAKTARCLVCVTPDAQRTMATYLGATRGITPVDIDRELIANAQVTYLEGYLWDEQNAKDALRAAMQTARASGRKVAFSLSDVFCVDRHRAEFWELVENEVDILFANEDELESLTQDGEFEASVNKIMSVCEIVCITRSEKGSVILSAGERIEIQALEGLDVEDTTGAGDLYAAGFLYGYTNGYSLEVSGRLGCFAASEVIQHIGARPIEKLSGLISKAAA